MLWISTMIDGDEEVHHARVVGHEVAVGIVPQAKGHQDRQ